MIESVTMTTERDLVHNIGGIEDCVVISWMQKKKKKGSCLRYLHSSDMAK